MFEASLPGDRTQVLQHCCANTLLLISVRDDEGDFGFVRPGDPIPRSGDNRHSKIISDESDQADLTDKIAIQERHDFFVGQVMLWPKEPIEKRLGADIALNCASEVIMRFRRAN
jgi:hypothetical protein